MKLTVRDLPSASGARPSCAITSMTTKPSKISRIYFNYVTSTSVILGFVILGTLVYFFINLDFFHSKTNDHSEKFSRHQIQVALDFVGTGSYLDNKDSVQVLFLDISVKNLAKDTFFFIFPYTSFFRQIIFEPSSLRTYGSCCDKNSLEKVYLLPYQKTVFHTMAGMNNLKFKSDKIRVGFVVIDTLNFKDFDNIIEQKRKCVESIYWSDYTTVNQNRPELKMIKKYDYGFSVIDSDDRTIFTSRP